MDSLIKGDVTEAAKEDSTGYNRHMNRYSIMVSSAVALIIFRSQSSPRWTES